MSVHHSIKSDVALQRACGILNISVVRGSDDQSRLKDLRQQGSYRAIFPRPIQGTVEAVIINTAGGITGGGRIRNRNCGQRSHQNQRHNSSR